MGVGEAWLLSLLRGGAWWTQLLLLQARAGSQDVEVLRGGVITLRNLSSDRWRRMGQARKPLPRVTPHSAGSQPCPGAGQGFTVKDTSGLGAEG